MKIITMFLCVFALSGLLMPTKGQADLQNRQRRLSALKLMESPTGQQLLGRFDDFEDIMDHYFVGDMKSTQEVLYETRGHTDQREIFLNGNVLAADYHYISWILAMAMAQDHIQSRIESFGLTSLPYSFVEYSQWAFILAMRHWEEIGAPNDLDYTKDPNKSVSEFPKRMRASVTEWHVAWRGTLRTFLYRVGQRHTQLNYGFMKLNQYYLQAPENQKAAVAALRDEFKALVLEECQRRNSNQCVSATK